MLANTTTKNNTVLFVITSFLMCTSCQPIHQGSIFSEQGSISKDIVIEKYMAAIQKGDKKSIENLIPQGLDAKQGITDKLDLYRNQTIEVQKICYEFGDKTSRVSASIFGGLTVNATGKKRSFTEKVTLLGQAGG
jgi:hypothetical protein